MKEQVVESIIGKNVVLTTDLTRYHPSLVKGSVGTIKGRTTEYFTESYNARFVKVKFDETTIDVIWKSIEFV